MEKSFPLDRDFVLESELTIRRRSDPSYRPYIDDATTSYPFTFHLPSI